MVIGRSVQSRAAVPVALASGGGQTVGADDENGNDTDEQQLLKCQTEHTSRIPVRTRAVSLAPKLFYHAIG